MLVTTRSQATHKQEETSTNMEGCFIEMEEGMRKMAEEVKNLRCENEALRRVNTELQDEAVGMSKKNPGVLAR